MQLLFIDQWFTDRLLKALSWMLVHSLWQGLIAALLAAIIISTTKKAVARIRYNLLGAVMILFLLAAIVTFCIELQQVVVAQPITETSSVIPVTDYYPAITAEAPAIINEKTPGVLDEFTNWFNSNTEIFILVWMAFFVFNCLKLVTGIAAVHRLRHYRTHSVTEEWTEKLRQLSAVVGIQKQVRFLQSELIKVPVTVGFLKPLILVPVGLVNHLSPEQVETILLHELAHIRRKDYLINIFQRIVEAVFFFNPAMMWLSSLIRQEREACCDDIVLEHTHQKRNYLDALVAFEEYTLLPMRYAVGFSGKRHYLLARVKRMVTRENKSLGILEKLILAGCIMLFMAFSFISREQEHETKKPGTIIAELEQLKSQEKMTPVVSQFKPELQRKLVRTALKPNIKLARLPFDTIPKPKDSAINFVGQKIMVVNEKGVEVNGKKQMHLKILVSDGRKFTVEKQDDQIVGLIFDGKRVAEKDLPKYIQLFQRVNSGGDGSVRIKETESKQALIKEREKTIQNEKGRIKSKIQELEKLKREAEDRKKEMDQLLKSGTLSPEQQKEVQRQMESMRNTEQGLKQEIKQVKQDMNSIHTMESQWKKEEQRWKNEMRTMEKEIEGKVEEQIQKEKDWKEAQEDNKNEKNKNQDKPGKKDGKDQGEGKGQGQGKGYSPALPTDAQWTAAANNRNGWKPRREPVFGKRPNKLFGTRGSKENQTKDAKPVDSGDEGKSKDKQADKKAGNKPEEMKQKQNSNSNSNSNGNGNSNSNDEGKNKDRKPQEKNDKEKSKDRKEAKEESDREKKAEEQSEKKEFKKDQKLESKFDVDIDVKLKDSRSEISLESGSNHLWATVNRKFESVKFDLKNDGFKLETNNMRTVLEDKIKVSSPVSIEQPPSPKPLTIKKPATISL